MFFGGHVRYTLTDVRKARPLSPADAPLESLTSARGTGVAEPWNGPETAEVPRSDRQEWEGNLRTRLKNK